MKHTEQYNEENQNPKYYLVKGLMLAFNKGLINFEMVEWVLKSVRRHKENERRPEKLDQLRQGDQKNGEDESRGPAQSRQHSFNSKTNR